MEPGTDDRIRWHFDEGWPFSAVWREKHTLTLDTCHLARCEIYEKEEFFPLENTGIRIVGQETCEDSALAYLSAKIH